MNTILLYIEEHLDLDALTALKKQLINIEYVNDVEINNKLPHDLLIEFESHHNLPVKLIETIKSAGYTADIYSA